MQLILSDLDQTSRLGRMFAQALMAQGVCPLLISGPLGAGKTTLIRYIVANLPGGGKAEVSSPSFNLVNIYPTHPEVVHMDLYRLGQTGMDDSLAEYLDVYDAALLVEWAENLPESALPDNFIRLQMEVREQTRTVQLSPCGDLAQQWLRKFTDRSFP
ncbi:MAG: tRNA (adenosine(37)-N6)-threonylcarbamoyltransferase complex ATPase subunit type 1 TsaE [Desulfovermiculus sp.]|nr:tRNA (adenosine(37)-N6)-threonylcarbamoyltransferase complex ATPase subunit type 1 TsaE [Desulfovermiculus sp.]